MAVEEVTDSSFDKEVINETEKLVLVDFWAEWCGPCKMLAPVIKSLSEKMEDSVKFLKLDTDANSTSAQKFQITSIPCCILFKDGKEVHRIIGFRNESAMSEEITKQL